MRLGGSVMKPYNSPKEWLQHVKELGYSAVIFPVDSTASALCKDNNIPILVFSIDDPENIYRAVCGETVGTVVSND